METGNPLGLGPLKENKQLVIEGVVMKPGHCPKPGLEQVRFRGRVGHGGKGVDTVGNGVDKGL
jgi:hypothetical protein